MIFCKFRRLLVDFHAGTLDFWIFGHVRARTKSEIYLTNDQLITVMHCMPMGLSTPTSNTRANWGEIYLPEFVSVLRSRSDLVVQVWISEMETDGSTFAPKSGYFFSNVGQDLSQKLFFFIFGPILSEMCADKAEVSTVDHQNLSTTTYKFIVSLLGNSQSCFNILD